MLLIRYAATGIATALVYVLLYNSLLSLVSQRIVAAATSYLGAVAFQYAAHSRFTFRKRIRSWPQALRFAASTLTGLVLASLLSHFNGVLYHIDDLILSLFVVALLAVLNFIVFRLWVFKDMGDGSGGAPKSNTLHPIELSVVVPCYNEADGLAELHSRVTAAATAELGQAFEIILVDDGSTDATWKGMTKLAERDQRTVTVRLSRNHGHQLALTAGLSVVRGAQVLVLDGDLQDPPELLGPMRRMMEQEQADVVYGQRTSRKGENWFKLLSADIFYRWMSRIAYVEIPRNTGDFRLMRRHISDLIVEMPERDRFIRGLVAWIGFRQTPFPYQRERRYAGRTKYTLRNMLRFAADAAFGFSMAPVRLAGLFATLSMIAAPVFLVYAFMSWLVLKTEPGWPSLIAVISFFFAVLFGILHLFGELLGRIYFETKGRPLYIIAEVKNRDLRMPLIGGRRWATSTTPPSSTTSAPAAGSRPES